MCLNLCAGGEGGCSYRSEETKNKISIAVSCENNPMYGRQHKEETRQIMSEAKQGDKNPATKIIYVDGQKFTCIKYATEYIGVSYTAFNLFKYRHNSGDYYKGHKIEWE